MIEPGEPELLAEGEHLRLVRKQKWEYLERTRAKLAAVVVPLTERNDVVFVEQFRIPVNAHVIEFPAGLVGDGEDTQEEDVLEAARRELFEETGYEGEEWQFLTEGPPSPGQSNEMVQIFLATGLRKTGSGGGDDKENIKVHAVRLADAEDWLNRQAIGGKMVDPKVYSGLYFLLRNISESQS